jgi:hypothetical protein
MIFRALNRLMVRSGLRALSALSARVPLVLALELMNWRSEEVRRQGWWELKVVMYAEGLQLLQMALR